MLIAQKIVDAFFTNAPATTPVHQYGHLVYLKGYCQIYNDEQKSRRYCIVSLLVGSSYVHLTSLT